MRRVICLGVVLIWVSALCAQDDRGVANDPKVNERANACFAGGSLAGKCHTTDADFDGRVDASDSAFMWRCGWYMIRVEQGLILHADAPEGCITQQAEAPAEPPQAPASTASTLPQIAFDPQNPNATPPQQLALLENVFFNGRIEVSGQWAFLYTSVIGGSPVAQMLAHEWDDFVAWYASP